MACRSGRTGRRLLEVIDVLEILEDGNTSDFGDNSESDDEDFDPGESSNETNVQHCDQAEEVSSDVSDGDDLPLSTFIATKKGRKQKEGFRWMKKEFDSPDLTFLGPPLPQPDTDTKGQLRSPLQYFRRFITDEIIELIVTYTNQYSVQKTGTCVDTTVKEIEQVVGLVLRMGIVQMSGIRVYYENDTRYEPVANVLGRNRLQLLLRTIHFVDNEVVPDEVKITDKLWKIRPFLNMFRVQCRLITPEEKQSVDEMMVPFKGKFSRIKQYLRGKPNPWGFKIWCRCSTSGLLHDFDVYQGKVGKREGKSSLGVGGDVVRKLCNTLPHNNNYKVFADNLFTSVALMQDMQKDGFQYIGTVRANRLSGCSLQTEKELAESGRGTFDFRVEQGNNIICVRWLDTKMVTLMSTYAGILPLDKARRWDKKLKIHKDVTRPFIIKEYNGNMGGVDLLDSCVARYKFPLKSRRWYMYLFWHSIQLAVVNAWLLYRRDCSLLSAPKPLIIRTFQARIASGLIEAGTARKRGRPSFEEGIGTSNPFPQQKKVRLNPNVDARRDQISRLMGHL